MVNGTGQFQMQGTSPQPVGSGTYLWSPARHPHQFICPGGCTFYLRSDAPFDIHYVNSAGEEIAPEKALKQVGERAAAMPQK